MGLSNRNKNLRDIRLTNPKSKKEEKSLLDRGRELLEKREKLKENFRTLDGEKAGSLEQLERLEEILLQLTENDSVWEQQIHIPLKALSEKTALNQEFPIKRAVGDKTILTPLRDYIKNLYNNAPGEVLKEKGIEIFQISDPFYPIYRVKKQFPDVELEITSRENEEVPLEISLKDRNGETFARIGIVDNERLNEDRNNYIVSNWLSEQATPEQNKLLSVINGTILEHGGKLLRRLLML